MRAVQWVQEERPWTRSSRREFSQQALGSLVTYSLLETLFAHDAFGAEIRPQTVEWLAQVNSLGRDAQQQKLPQLEWQKQIERLFSQVNLPDLLRMIDFDQIDPQYPIGRSRRFEPVV